jgi:hypothetical protein
MHLALLSVRNVSLFAIVAVGPLAATADRLLDGPHFGRKLRAAEDTLALRRSKTLTAAFYMFTLAVLLGLPGRTPDGFAPPSSFPIVAARHLPPGQLFTTDRWADYLIYSQPGRQVFFDGRNDAYGAQIVEDYLIIMRAMPGWQLVLDKYSLQVVLVPKASAITAALSESHDWKVFYQDSIVAVFTRSTD